MRRRRRRSLLLAVAGASLLTGAPLARAAQNDADVAARPAVAPPRLLRFVPADFPPSEIASEKGATVTLQIAIKDTGEVALVTVLEPAGAAFDAAAVAAASQFVFEPATSNGQPDPGADHLPLRVHLDADAHQEDDGGLRGDGARARRQEAGSGRQGLARDGGVRGDRRRRTVHVHRPLAGRAHGHPLGRTASPPSPRARTLEAGKKLEATYEIERTAEKAAGRGGRRFRDRDYRAPARQAGRHHRGGRRAGEEGAGDAG